MKEIVKRLEAIESRLSRIEAFIGVGEFDADHQATNLHRRLDTIEDRVYDRGDY